MKAIDHKILELLSHENSIMKSNDIASKLNITEEEVRNILMDQKTRGLVITMFGVGTLDAEITPQGKLLVNKGAFQN